MTDKKWEIYLVECLDGTIYTGVTNNLSRRMKMHASGKGSKYVRAKGFGKLLAHKECNDKISACKLEYFVKQLTKEEKLNFFIK
ncbi:GIY-YIG nuclease family protein [Candidatus Pacearchaeota archaeon]|nr:GIY-YIG nuclease family protein [Candidatus Pacearchaeota archaeon]